MNINDELISLTIFIKKELEELRELARDQQRYIDLLTESREALLTRESERWKMYDELLLENSELKEELAIQKSVYVLVINIYQSFCFPSVDVEVYDSLIEAEARASDLDEMSTDERSYEVNIFVKRINEVADLFSE